jgi:hypothetical protein
MLSEGVLFVSQAIALECSLEADGLGDRELPLPLFFRGSGSTLRQTGGSLDRLGGDVDCRLLTEIESFFVTSSLEALLPFDTRSVDFVAPSSIGDFTGKDLNV